MTASDLSGRVLDLEKQVLGLPTRGDFQALQHSSSSRFNIVEGDVSDLYEKFEDLNRKVVNLQLFGVTGSTTGNHSHVSVEVPAGTINGVNDTFLLQTIPVPAAGLLLFKNGLLQRQGAGNDYLLSSRTITFSSDNIPQSNDNILATYTV